MSCEKILPPAGVEYDQRYILRPVTPSDVPEIEKAFHASIKSLHAYMAWSHRPTSRTLMFDRIVTQWLNYYRGDEFEMALFDKATGEFLMYTGFYPSLRINPRSFEIGYWTSSFHKGKGLATLATQMQIALIFEYFKGDRVEITSSIENRASLAVIKKCGFHFEGQLRNFYPQGTEEMYINGYVKERRVSLYSLIPEDRPTLAWYGELLEKVVVHPLFDPPQPLSYYAKKVEG